MWSVIAMSLFGLVAWFFLQLPSHDRNWELGHEELPRIDIVDDEIVVTNMRDFLWTTKTDAQPRYSTETFSLNELETVDVIISHFEEYEGMAHIFLSFGFHDGRHLIVSVETRREDDEEFSPLKGIFRKFEIIYVVGTERDIIGLRTDLRGERVYLYPTVATQEQARELFIKIAQDVNAIDETPHFYHTLLNNCTNAITRRVEDISTVQFPLTYKTLLPGFFDEVLYEMQLIPHDGTFFDVKKKHLINNAVVDRNDQNFEVQIRSHFDE